jgi:hypothetical protein
MIYLDWLDEYLLNDIYSIVYRSYFNNVMEEMKWKFIFYNSLVLNSYDYIDFRYITKIPKLYRYQFNTKIYYTFPNHNRNHELFCFEKYGNKFQHDLINEIKYLNKMISNKKVKMYFKLSQFIKSEILSSRGEKKIKRKYKKIYVF